MRGWIRGESPIMRRCLPLLVAVPLLVFGGSACDDNAEDPTQIDEDDTNFGPGDGNDETGPGR